MSRVQMIGQPSQHHPFWDLAFRPWFLLASLSSMASLIIWLAYLNSFSLFLSQGVLHPVVWHTHEMLFGFAATVALGFLLTAVQTWTSQRSLHGKPLIALTILWLLSRGLIWSQQPLLQSAALVTQMLWWLASIGYIAYLLISTHNYRNMLFIPLLGGLMLANLGILSAGVANNDSLAIHLAHTSILLFGLLVSIVGGRVIPFFTRSGTAHSATPASIPSTPLLDKLLISLSLAGVGVFFSGYFTALPISPSWLMISAGILHLIRLGFWQSLKSLTLALLWSLHLSYSALGVGLIALGASEFIDALSFSNALHIIALGTIAAMILSMMSRVSLGHTGRSPNTDAISKHPIMIAALASIFFAALARFLLPLLGTALMGWNISGLLWLTGFGTFIVFYLPILTSQTQAPRPLHTQ